MHAQDAYRTAVTVTLPEEIDLINREDAYDRLYAAFACGAPVVIADLTGTTFCDAGSLRRLVTVQNRAAAQGTQLRLVIAPGSVVSRLAGLTGLDRRILIYPNLREAGLPRRLDDDALRRSAPPRGCKSVLGDAPSAA